MIYKLTFETYKGNNCGWKPYKVSGPIEFEVGTDFLEWSPLAPKAGKILSVVFFTSNVIFNMFMS